MGLNICTIMGRLTRDVELRHTNTGTAVASFSLAVERDRKNDNGERDSDFIDCVAWDKTAEFVERNISKGQRIVVSGRLQIRRWKDSEGNNRRKAEIVANSVYFADAPRKSEEGSYASNAENYGPAPSSVHQDAYAEIDRMKQGEIKELGDDDIEGDLPF